MLSPQNLRCALFGALLFGMLFTGGCDTSYSPQSGVGQPCDSSTDCPGGLICVANVCIDPSGPGPGPDAGPNPDGGSDVDPDLPIPDGGTTCNPGDRVCESARVELRCTPDGSRWVSRDCEGDDVCIDGTCRPDTPDDCDEGERRCRGARAQRCEDDEWVNVANCASQDAICRNGQCEEISECRDGSRRCRGNTVEVCERGFWRDGPRCPDNATCSGGECLPAGVCRDGQRRCRGRRAQVCEDESWETVQRCESEDLCVDGRCLDEGLPNLAIEYFFLGGGEFFEGDFTFADVGVVNLSNVFIDEPTLCTVWLAFEPILDPEFLFDTAFPVSDFDLPPIGPGEGFGFGIEVPLFAPPGFYFPVVECNTLETFYPESTYEDNLFLSPEPVSIIPRNDECIEDMFEFGPQPAPIGPGGYFLGLCDGFDEFTFTASNDSFFFLEIFPHLGDGDSFYEVILFNEQTGEAYFDEVLFGGEPFYFEGFLEAGRYNLLIIGEGRPFNYDMFLEYEFGGEEADIAVDFVEAFVEEPRPGGFGFITHGVFNAGGVPVGATTSALVFSRDDFFSPDDIIVDTYSIPPLSIGQGTIEDREFVVPPVPPGEWFIIYVADYFNQVAEFDEFNNQWIANIVFIGDQIECFDDFFEPNNSRNQAVFIEPSSYEGLNVCGGNEDWYGFCIEGGQRLDIDLFFNHAQGDIDIELEDEFGMVVEGSYSVSNTESVAATAGVGGCYYARVYLCCSELTTNYELFVEVSDQGECSSALEPNNSRERARWLFTAIDRADLGICPATDVDVYFVDLAAGQRLLVGAITENDFGLQMVVTDEDGGFVSASAGVNPTVSLFAPNDQVYFIELLSEAGVNTPYQLFVQDL